MNKIHWSNATAVNSNTYLMAPIDTEITIEQEFLGFKKTVSAKLSDILVPHARVELKEKLEAK